MKRQIMTTMYNNFCFCFNVNKGRMSELIRKQFWPASTEVTNTCNEKEYHCFVLDSVVFSPKARRSRNSSQYFIPFSLQPLALFLKHFAMSCSLIILRIRMLIRKAL